MATYYPTLHHYQLCIYDKDKSTLETVENLTKKTNANHVTTWLTFYIIHV